MTNESTVPLIVRVAVRVLLRHVEPGWDNCREFVRIWLDHEDGKDDEP